MSDHTSMKPETSINHWIGASLAGWELAGFAARILGLRIRIPLITDVLRKHPILAALAVAWVADHLVRPR